MNITLQSSLPIFDRDSLVLSANTYTQDEVQTITVRILLSDPDGTTQDVRMNITHNLQQWEANLSDADGDGVWEGSLEWRPETPGRPLLKIIARDGVGESANIDVVSRNLVVETPEDDNRAVVLGASIAGVVGLAGLLAFVLARRRRP